MDKYLLIQPQRGYPARQWARIMWDTYCFDYDNEHPGNTVFAWPEGVTMDELKANLDADGIEYEEIEVDTDRHFGLVDDVVEQPEKF